MKKRYLPFLFFPLFLFPKISISQTAADVVVPVSVTVSNSPAAITLNWSTGTGVASTIVGRKSLFDFSWTTIAQLPPTTNTFTDTDVAVGEAWEYIVLQSGTPQRVGLVMAGIEVPPNVFGYGRVCLLVDDNLSAPLAAELAQFEADLRGDGWQISRKNINTTTATVASVKSEIRSFYNEDPQNSTAAFLFGNLPVPYSGNIAPDGHGDHVGAWPTDYYYADMDEASWTDVSVNNSAAARPANRNVPGDGKFDQSQTPTLPELIVSRVDFSNLSGWSVSKTELYRRYLVKNHRFRSGEFRPDQKTLVDDNFGYFSGEAFAQSGWRAGYALTGVQNTVAGDFFTDTDTQSYLVGYGCGGGWYQGASGVGTSDDFKNDSVNVVFSMLFGSYHGDWDHEDNPFMPSALASKGSILTCAWAGRPAWTFHHMGMGLPIAYSTLWVYLNSFLPAPVYPASYGDDQIHVGLLGDPTLRAQAARPPKNVAAVLKNCNSVEINWAASPDATHGYLIYRSEKLDGEYVLLSQNPVATTNFTDAAPLAGQNFYQIKTLKLENVPTGSYFNQSTGVPANVNFNATPPSLALEITPVSCFGKTDGAAKATATGGATPIIYEWSNGNVGPWLDQVVGGIYYLTATDANGCTSTATANVAEPADLQFSAAAADAKCFGENSGTVVSTVSGGTAGYSFLWSNNSTAQNLTNLVSGIYSATLTDSHGCTKTTSATVGQPTALNFAAAATAAKCFGENSGSVVSTVSGGTAGYNFLWSNNSTTQNLINLVGGIYSATLTDANGCTKTASATVGQPTEISIQTSTTQASCNGTADGSVNLTVSGGAGNFIFLWSNGSTAQNLTNVAAGNYSVTATDASNCTKTATVLVEEKSSIQITENVFNPPCFGFEGYIGLTVSGGTAGYSFLWSDGSDFDEIYPGAGNHSVTVTDAAGCDKIANFTLTAPPQIIVTATTVNPKCNLGQDGSITAAASGGTGSFTYLWDDGSTGATLSNLYASSFGSSYHVTVTDNSGCQTDEKFTLVAPPNIQFSLNSAGYFIPCNNPLTMTTTASGGTPPYSYLWSDGSTDDKLTTSQKGPYP